MALTPKEVQALAAIEQQLALEDPKLERRLTGRGRFDWSRAAGLVSSPIRFRLLLGVLLASAPAALAFLDGAAAIGIGLVGYLLGLTLVLLRAQVRPFAFPRTRRLWEAVREDKTGRY